MMSRHLVNILIRLMYYHANPNLLKLKKNECLISSNDFYTFIKVIICFLSLNILRFRIQELLPGVKLSLHFWLNSTIYFCVFIYILKFLFIYLAALALSCGTQDF